VKNLHELDAFRLDASKTHGWSGDGTCGQFRLLSPIDRAPLMIQASSESGWDHVSVSRLNRCPNWPEMDHVRKLFFKDDEVVMQLHMPSKDNINLHQFCLHLWRPQNVEIPLPPKEMV
jgi:hypothetical protein